MNLLEIEMLILILGVGLTVWIFFNLVGLILSVSQCIKEGVDWEYDITTHTIVTIIGILLIVISQNI